MRIARLPEALVLSFGILVCSACDDTPTRPTPVPFQTPSSIPASPPKPAVVRAEMIGPQVMPLNTAAQFRLIAHLADGSSRDATEEVFWYVTDDSPFSMLSKGLVKSPTTPGEAIVSAYKGNGDGEVEFEASSNVMALAPGTYKLRGVVWEENSPTWPVGGARVEVRLSDGSTLTTDTDNSGQYQFLGVSGEVRLRASRDGYERVTKYFQVSRHLGYDVRLPLLKPRLQVSGTYTMTLKVTDHCGTGLGEGLLPENVARVRAYRVDVQQDGPSLELRVSAPAVRVQSTKIPFSGTVAPDGVTFDLGYDEYRVFEDLPESGVLEIIGGATVRGDSNRLSGTFGGNFRVYDQIRDTSDFDKQAVAWCYSSNHRIELSR